VLAGRYLSMHCPGVAAVTFLGCISCPHSAILPIPETKVPLPLRKENCNSYSLCLCWGTVLRERTEEKKNKKKIIKI
jgi:hypothetical protein